MGDLLEGRLAALESATGIEIADEGEVSVALGIAFLGLSHFLDLAGEGLGEEPAPILHDGQSNLGAGVVGWVPLAPGWLCTVARVVSEI